MTEATCISVLLPEQSTITSWFYVNNISILFESSSAQRRKSHDSNLHVNSIKQVTAECPEGGRVDQHVLMDVPCSSSEWLAMLFYDLTD